MQVKKQWLELDIEDWTGSKLGKEYVKTVYHPAYLICMQSKWCKMPGQMKHKLESRLRRKRTKNFIYADDTTLMAESEEELKSFLMKMKEESEKVGLKLNIPKTKIMVSCPIQLSSVQSFSRVQLFATPWITARQASLSITNSQSSLRLMSNESEMPSSYLILCYPLLLLPPIPPSIRVFSNESTLRMRWPKYWSFSFSIIPSKEILSCPITSWQIDRGTMETVTDFIFLGSKITEDGDCSHEIKRHLLLGRKVMTKLDSVLKK